MIDLNTTRRVEARDKLIEALEDENGRLRAELAQSRELCTKFEAAVGEDVGTILQFREFAGWVDAWVSNPVGAYSVHALDGLFRMTREKLAALSPSHSETP